MRCTLVIEEAQSIVVVKVESYPQFFTSIDAKLGTQMVFAVLFVSTLIVADIGIGRQCV